MTRVKVGELDPGLYEDMVAVLLSNVRGLGGNPAAGSHQLRSVRTFQRRAGPVNS